MDVSTTEIHAHASHGGGSHAPKSFTRPQSNPQTTSDSPQRQTSRAANATPPPVSADSSAQQQPKADDKPSFHSILNHYYSSDSSENSDSGSSDSGDAKGQQDSSQDSNTTAVAPVDSGTARKDIAPLTLTLSFPRNIDITAPSTASTGSTSSNTTATAETQTASSSTASSNTVLAADAEEIAPAPAPTTQIENESGSTTQRGDLAFAAKLTPVATDNGKAQTQQQSNNNSQDSGTDTKQRAQTQAVQQQTQVTTKSNTSSQTDDQAPLEKQRTAFVEAAPKPAATTMLAQEPAQSSGQMAATAKPIESAPQTNAGEVARIEQAMNMPAPAASSHDITVRIADAGQHGADIRFVEHAGEVRVTVKTADAEMAQTLRSGLNDFANRMEQSGIRTEVWRPGADANSSQNPQDQFADQRGRQQNRDSRDSRNAPQQENQNSNKPRWVEELETSLSNKSLGSK